MIYLLYRGSLPSWVPYVKEFIGAYDSWDLMEVARLRAIDIESQHGSPLAIWHEVHYFNPTDPYNIKYLSYPYS